MKKLIAASALLAGTALAFPALAQVYSNDAAGQGTTMTSSPAADTSASVANDADDGTTTTDTSASLDVTTSVGTTDSDGSTPGLPDTGGGGGA